MVCSICGRGWGGSTTVSGSSETRAAIWASVSGLRCSGSAVTPVRPSTACCSGFRVTGVMTLAFIAGKEAQAASAASGASATRTAEIRFIC